MTRCFSQRTKMKGDDEGSLPMANIAFCLNQREKNRKKEEELGHGSKEDRTKTQTSFARLKIFASPTGAQWRHARRNSYPFLNLFILGVFSPGSGEMWLDGSYLVVSSSFLELFFLYYFSKIKYIQKKTNCDTQCNFFDEKHSLLERVPLFLYREVFSDWRAKCVPSEDSSESENNQRNKMFLATHQDERRRREQSPHG